MRYIVTGGAGFIGSHLVDALIERGDEVVVIDNLSLGKIENLNLNAKFYQFDIRDYQKIRPLFDGIDGVFHLAAIPRVPFSIANPIETTQVNICGAVNVFWAAKDAGVRRVLFASSSAVYGNQAKLPLVETMIPRPLSPYGFQKFACEEYARLFKELYNFPIISLRYFNVYGPRADFNSEYSLVIGKFIKQRLENKPLTIFGDGNQSRGFSYVSDVVTANIAAMLSDNIYGGEIINIGSSKPQTINHIADLIGREKTYLPPRPGDILHTKADTNLAKNLFSWEQKVDFETGIEIVKQYFGLKR